jgi:hypothetical protein
MCQPRWPVIDRRLVVGRSFTGPVRSVDSNYPFARHCKHLKRIGPLRSGRVLRHVLQTIRGSVMEIHYGAGRAAGAEHVTVTLYRGVFNSSDLQKVATFRTGIDGLYHFENIPKGEYTIHVQGPNVKEPNWGPAAYRRASVANDNAVIELDPTVIDYK